MMAVIPGVPPRATWRAVPTSTPVLQLVLVILEKKSTNNPFIAFTNTAGQTFNGTTSQGICVSASLEQFFCTWLSHSSSLERARSEVVTWCCGVLLHPALEWPKLRFETTHPVETLRVSHPILLYFFFFSFILYRLDLRLDRVGLLDISFFLFFFFGYSWSDWSNVSECERSIMIIISGRTDFSNLSRWKRSLCEIDDW